MTQILVSEELYPQIVFTILRSMWNVLTCPLSQILCNDNTLLKEVRNTRYTCSQGLVCWAPSITFTDWEWNEDSKFRQVTRNHWAKT